MADGNAVGQRHAEGASDRQPPRRVVVGSYHDQTITEILA